MRERIKFMIIYFAFWTIYFLSARFIFLGYHVNDTKLLTLETLFGIFWNGTRMDLSMAAYLSFLPFVWITFSNFIKKTVFQGTIFTYTFISVFCVSLIIVVDLEVYNIWSFRLDATPLNYLSSPREAWASVKSSPVIQLFISFILLIIISSYIVYRILADKIDNWKFINNFPFIFYGLLISLFLIIPIRGGFGIAPMNHSTVYFSKNNFANISAINPTWNFFSSIFNKTSKNTNPYSYLPKEVIDYNLGKLLTKSKSSDLVLNSKKPNVLIIVWESFTKKVVDEKYNGIEVTPNFNSLKKEGIYFSNIYASGDRTDKALTALLSAFPAQPTESIIKQPLKSSSLSMLSKDFAKNGYSTSFYYGGDTDFANIKSYLYNSNFDKIIDKNDFPLENHGSKWGVHDAFIFNKYIEDNKTGLTKPFFNTLLTLSSHEPFETSRNNIIIEGDNVEAQFMNSLNYTDECLGDFIQKAKLQPWWSNTLVIIISDHGKPLESNKIRSDEFEIPMLWTGGAIKNSFNFNKIGSQLDLAATLLGQLNIENTKYNWSKDLFGKNTKQWAFFAFNDGFGYVKPGKTLIWDNVGKRPITKNGDVKTQDIREGKTLQQASFADFLAR